MIYVTRQFIVLTKKFRKELHKYQETLHRDLMQISDGFKNLKDSIDQQGQSDEKTDQTQPSISITDLRTNVPIPVEDKTQKTTPKWIWAITKGALEVFVGVAVILYTGVTYENWQEQIDATNFAGIQAKKARETMNETLKDFRLEQRAWIAPYFPPANGQPNPLGFASTDFSTENIGKTEAHDLRADTAVIWVRLAFFQLRSTLPANSSILLAFGPPRFFPQN